MMLTASVPMNELTFVLTTISPVTVPSRAPTSTAPKKPAATPKCWVSITPEMAETARVAVEERSKTPLMMHSVAAAASSPTTAAWSNRLMKLRPVRNVPVFRARKSMMAARPKTIPKSLRFRLIFFSAVEGTATVVVVMWIHLFQKSGSHDFVAGGASVELGHNAPVPHDMDTVGQAEHFLELGADHDDGCAFRSQFNDDAVDPRLSGDVHPPGWFI